jgi:hypothetical protein
VSTLGLAELADRTCLEAGGWSVVVAPEPRIAATTEELKEELAFLLEQEGVGSVRVFSERLSGPALIEELALLGPEDVALLPLPADVQTSVSRSLDYGRGRLVGRPRGVILTSEAGVRVLAMEAPNFWSWVGPRVWHLDPLAGHLDPEARLASLRQWTGLSDAEVIERAEAGTLQADPVFAEWLVLLGKGDLLGR